MASRKKRFADSKVGNIAKAGIYTTRLPQYIKFFEVQIDRLNSTLARQERRMKEIEKSLESFSREVKTFNKVSRDIDEKVNDIKHQLYVNSSSKTQHKQTVSVNETMADDHSHDRFYKAFEDRFRGSEDFIKERLIEYNPYLQRLPKMLKKLPVLDLGCGRGEFLEIVKQAGFKGVGVDMNKSMIDRAKDLGYKAYENDALSYLLKQKPSSYAVISGFHLVEHIPFPMLLKIFEECYRVIHEDGFVLFETPNPNNLTVGSSNFYMDPSHIKPLPPKLLAFAMEVQGFFTQILELHPAHQNIKHQDPVIEDIMRMVYGPADYAVLASKKPFKLKD
jgi:2-polyprenyl-3-methyl-5-hydroxy-6-metoxy-1,4-benzoquinol methylase